MTAAAAVKPKAKAATKTTRAPKPANAGIAAAAQAGVEPAVPVSLMEQALRYQIDRWQRSLMLLDTFRERANNMLAHETAGMPPPLHFEYETILDARLFERPAN